MPTAPYGPYTVCKGEISTGVTVNTGDTIRIRASGDVDFGSGWAVGIGAPIEGPGGPASKEIAVAPYPGVGFVKNSLIFKIGAAIFQGDFDITVFHTGPSGVLSLLPNDDRPEDNSRGWTVLVDHTTPNPPPPPPGTPVPIITAIEVIQAIQKVDNSVPLVAGHRTVVRAYISSGSSTPLGNITGRIDFTSFAPNGTQTSLFATPLNGPITASVTPNRDSQNDSLNFEVPIMLTHDVLRIEVHAWVGAVAPPGGETVRICGIEFQQRKKQELLPLLIQDTRTTAPVPPIPNITDFFASMQGAIDRLPLADPRSANPGFLLSRARTIPFSGDLTQKSGFQALLSDITHLIFWLEGDAGGTRAAITANNSNYAINGISTGGQFLNALSFVAQSGLQETFAHELAHTFGIRHAPRCTSSSDGIDSRLPGGTEDVGFHVAQNTLIPRNRGELMSYSGDASRCSGASRWPSIALWSIIYDHFR
jgi:hypothetical protein